MISRDGVPAVWRSATEKQLADRSGSHGLLRVFSWSSRVEPVRCSGPSDVAGVRRLARCCRGGHVPVVPARAIEDDDSREYQTLDDQGLDESPALVHHVIFRPVLATSSLHRSPSGTFRDVVPCDRGMTFVGTMRELRKNRPGRTTQNGAIEYWSGRPDRGRSRSVKASTHRPPARDLPDATSST